jgi:hypothetical protein
MSTSKSRGASDLVEILRAIESRDWDALDKLVGMSPEEAERILREDPSIDLKEFIRMSEEAEPP